MTESEIPQPATAAATPEKPDTFNGNVRWAACVLAVILLVQSVVIKPFYIPSVSMMPTLITGDRIMVTKYPYGWSWVSMVPRILTRSHWRVLGRLPERGDVVIVNPPVGTADYIKRVIGLPGDRIEMRHGQLILNGVPVKRVAAAPTMIPIDENVTCTEGLQQGHRVVRGGKAYCSLPVFRETLPNGRSYDTIDLGYVPMVDDYGPITVPDDDVFLMGDNRDQSSDSRVSSDMLGLDGPVPFSNIGGRAEIVTFSLDGSGRIYNPASWFAASRSSRAGLSLRR